MGEVDMNLPRVVDSRPMGWPTLAGFAVVIATNAFAAGIVYWQFRSDIQSVSQRVDAMEAFRRDRTAATDKNFAELKEKLEPLDNLQDQAARADAEIEAANARIDRIVESFGGKFDDLIATVNQIKVDLGVLTGEVRSLTNGKRAALEPPALSPLDPAAFNR